MSESSSTSSFPTAQASAKSPSAKRYSAAFKQDAVNLIVQEGYSFAAAARAVGVSEKSLRDWHKKLVPAPTLCGEDASLDDLKQENKRLREQLRQAQMEREILKKATAYFASQKP